LPVRGLSTGYFGLSAEIEIGALNRLMDEGAAISGVHVRLDPAAQADFHAAAKAMPKTAFVTLKATTQRRFAETMSENMTIMTTVYVTLAAIIAFGVVYNAARISLSEQGRDLASLRVLGFSPAEVAAILFGELAAIVLAAQPLGWLLGYALARGMVASLSSDLYQVPLVIGREVYATASVVVLAAALVSALAMWGRIRALDMIAVLKTRE
jgi:putative ABC transport system permease protein